ncbi:MAG TPA: 1-(5-phosphoribosyl)-5-[(5-phosphoribosylamino)methylideneamino]imidazole-4-carboxamide isomerase [bacterium]
MMIIPAIDIMDGKCVRLYQGQKNMVKEYHNDPAEIAKQWESKGAKLLHVVDLDGAFSGEPQNQRVVERIVDSVRIPIEVGGGIRSEETIEEYLEIGAARIVLGTRVVQDPGFLSNACMSYGERIILGVDAKNGLVAINGWEKVTSEDAVEFARRFEELGIGGIIYTDLLRDGTLIGPNTEAIRNFASSIDLPVIASGGVSSVEDIVLLSGLEKDGVTGVIVGKALYEGKIDLEEALKRIG